LHGINNLNFTGGNSRYNFGSYKIGFDSTFISRRMRSFEKNFVSKTISSSSLFDSLIDSFDVNIKNNINMSSSIGGVTPVLRVSPQELSGSNEDEK